MILDLHIHTSWNSADSNLSPIELIREAKRLGLDGVVVTEHDRGWDRFRARELAAEHDFLFLRGMEVSTDLGHILVCGLEEYVSGIQRAEKLRQVVDEVGGIMIAAHPFRRAFTPDFRHGKEPTPLTLAEAARRPIFDSPRWRGSLQRGQYRPGKQVRHAGVRLPRTYPNRRQRRAFRTRHRLLCYPV